MAKTKSKHKYNRSVIEMDTKLKIIRDRENGDRVQTLVKRYHVNSTTITKIWKRRDSYVGKDYAAGAVCTGYPTKRTNLTENMEIQVNQWIDEESIAGRTVTGNEICEKALMFHQILLTTKQSEPSCSRMPDKPEPVFKASSGWLHRFLKRRERKVKKGKFNYIRFKTCSTYVLFLMVSILKWDTNLKYIYLFTDAFFEDMEENEPLI